MNRRVESLDYLRGLMAVAVMAYHYASVQAPPLGLLGKLGIYAVATFYVLSGVSLGMVYRDKLGTVRDMSAFALRRIFRIAPMLWIATAATLALGMVPASPGRIALNYTLSFGFIDPPGAIAMGGWSIGNEMVFYAMLPLLVRLPRAAFAASLALGGYYAWSRLSADASLQSQWSVYVQPLNHLFLFAGGVAIALMRKIRFPALLGAAAIAVFCLFPMESQISIATGPGRAVMSASILLLVLAVYQGNPTFSGLPAKALSFLGQGCYSIYLLHPIVLRVVGTVGASGRLLVPLSIAITLALSYLTYRRIEKPMMDLGARLSRRLQVLDEAPAAHGGEVGAAGVLRPLE